MDIIIYNNAVHQLRLGIHTGDDILCSELVIILLNALHELYANLCPAHYFYGLSWYCFRRFENLLHHSNSYKNKRNMCTSTNYRGIALGSKIEKIVVVIMLNRLSERLATAELQFGFNF